MAEGSDEGEVQGQFRITFPTGSGADGRDRKRHYINFARLKVGNTKRAVSEWIREVLDRESGYKGVSE